MSGSGWWELQALVKLAGGILPMEALCTLRIVSGVQRTLTSNSKSAHLKAVRPQANYRLCALISSSVEWG